MLFPRSYPFQALLDLQRSMDSALRSNWLAGTTAGRGSFPPINVFQKGEDFVAIIELAGVAKDDLNIEVKEGLIRISGEKKVDLPEGVSSHRRERIFGAFDRTVSIPSNIDSAGVKAEYRDGILALLIPRAEADKPRKVNIN